MTTTDTTGPVRRRRAPRSPNGPGRTHNVKVPDDEWETTDEIAAARGETMGAAIRWGLEEYRRRYGP